MWELHPYLISFFLLIICDQPVHSGGSSAYGSMTNNDHLLGMTSSSESLSNGSGNKMRQEEEEQSSKTRPVSILIKLITMAADHVKNQISKIYTNKLFGIGIMSAGQYISNINYFLAHVSRNL